MNARKTDPNAESSEADVADLTKPRLLAWVKDGARTGEELATVCGRFPEIDRALASRPNIKAETLSSLSHSGDKATRARVAANPATPAVDLLRLGQQFPNELLANPALDLLLLENPALLETIPHALLVRLLKSERCPAEFLVWAATHADEKVQLAVAMNAAAPQSALEELARSGHAVVRDAAMARTADPAAGLRDSERCFVDAVKERIGHLRLSDALEAWRKRDIGIAQYGSLAPVVRLTLSGVDWCSVGHAQPLTDDVLKALADDSSAAMRHVAASNCSVCVDLLNVLAGDDDWLVRAAVAANPKTPEALLSSLSRDEDDAVRSTVARNPRTPGVVLRALSADANSLVRSEAMMSRRRRKTTPTPVSLNDGSTRDGQNSADVMAGPIAADDIARALNWDLGAEARIRLGESPETPPYVLAALAEDESVLVRAAVSANPGAPVALLEVMARKPVVQVLRGLLANPSLPLAVLQRLAESRRDVVRRELARHVCTPEWVLERLASDCSDEELLASLFTHPSSSPAIREKVWERLSDPQRSPWYIKQLARSPVGGREAVQRGDLLYFCGLHANRSLLSHRPLAALMVLSSGVRVEPSRISRVIGSTDWLVRAAVARNHQTPKGLVKKLLRDTHPLVRALAASCLERSEGMGSTLEDLKAGANLDSMPSGACGLQHGTLSNASHALGLDGPSEAVGLLATCCPNCGGAVAEAERIFECRGPSGSTGGCGFSFVRSPAGRTLSKPEAETFLQEGRLGPLKFRSRSGTPFVATLALVRDEESGDLKLQFQFDSEPEATTENRQPSLGPIGEAIGPCPSCRGRVFQYEDCYCCENAEAGEPRCAFRIAQVLFRKAVPRKEVRQLLESGRTGLLKDLVSSKTGRRFAAYLVWSDEDERIQVERKQEHDLRSAIERWQLGMRGGH